MAQLEVSLPDLVVQSTESEVEIPIYIEGLPPAEIEGYTFKIAFNSDVISIYEASITNTLSDGGTLTANYSPVNNPENQVNISWASTGSISEDGVILTLLAEINDTGSSLIEFIDAEINEGDPPFTMLNGSVEVKDNEAPFVENPLGTIEIPEDFNEEIIEDINSVFNDDFTQELSIEILNYSEQLISAEIDGNSIILSSIDDVFGSGEVVLSATDEEGLSVSDTLFVNIQSVNDLPQFTQIPDTISFVSGKEYTFPFSDIVFDIEDEVTDLSFSFDIQPEELTFEVSLTAFEITISAPDFVGEGLLTFIVEDSDGGIIEEEIVLVVVSSVSSEIDPNLPVEFNLSQNYPNPFNPTTQIQFQLAEATEVQLRVFDMTGRMVYDHGIQNRTAGTHFITFDASTLSSGLYVYQIKAGPYSDSKVMTLIK
jgi:hypothetical protein